jgi:cytochrome c551/c552
MISRVFLEKVGDDYQGAAFAFRSGFQSGVLRMAWARDGSLFVGETNRGWGSAGDANQGLQRLVWNGRVPFEMRAVRAMPDGFEIEFTQPVSKGSAEDISAYEVESYTYKYHPVYGSPTVNRTKNAVRGVKLSADGMRARIIVNGLRKGYIHQITVDGVRTREGSYSLVHPVAYYTLNNIPEGQKLSLTEVSTKSGGKKTGTPEKGKEKKGANEKTTGLTTPDDPNAKAGAKPAKTAEAKTVSFATVKPLLQKNTCTSCHNTDKRQVGPAFKDIAKRNYTVDKIVNLIYKPQPQNWPGYATEMPPMPQVPREEARQIAMWIRTLK